MDSNIIIIISSLIMNKNLLKFGVNRTTSKKDVGLSVRIYQNILIFIYFK